MKTAALLVALLASTLSLPARADTLNWLGAKLPNGPGDPWTYVVDGRKAKPGGLALSSIESAIKSAYQGWQDVSCAYIEFSYGGLDTTHGIRPNDGANVMGTFLETKTEDEELYDNALGGGAALAVALPLYYSGTIYGCDFAYNAVDYTWAVDGSSNKFDVQSVANQETGHCLGLDHYNGDNKAVMYPFVAIGELRRVLQPHDVDNLCQVYPQQGQVGSPCPSATCDNGLTCAGTGKTAYCTKGCDPAVANQCPVGFSCTASQDVAGFKGSCTFGGGAAILVGAPCTKGPDCGPGGLCFQQDVTTGSWSGGYCTSDCTSNPCPANSSCYDDLGTTAHYCLKDCRPGFGDCRDGYSCEPLSTGGGRCRPSCRSDQDCGGSTCRSCDGLCIPPGKAGANVGDACSTDADCPVGGLCRKDIGGGTCTLSCATACTPCPQGSSCLAWGSTGEKLCFKACTSGADCRQGFGCVASGCRPGCTKEVDCPVGLTCVAGSCAQKNPPDAGCALCGDHDAGDSTPVTKPPATEPVPPAGCGCSSTAASAPLAFVLFAALALVRRRKNP